ncbi:alpha/beta fold hydrolase [Azospirillum halopraeferens]|uniref:alpha/beta fold hydrolase n=1 Tax=Azospirillum halopraeferens TaxID=34010 RepID=UPI00041E0709|nr:alpha/beta fold hydrolase [Azospirillum halopraeferens]
MKTVHLDDVVIATEAFGRPDHPAVVLIMGATASMLGWPDALCRGLADRGYFVIRYDHRDTGRSTTVAPGAAGYAVEDLAGDLVGVMDAYGLADAHLVGMSLGGLIGQLVTLDHLQRVASLTLIGSEPLDWDGPPLPHIAPAFMEHFAGSAELDWSDREAVTDFLLGIARLCAGSAHPLDVERTRAEIGAVLSRTRSIASAFNHGTVQLRHSHPGRFRAIARPVLVIHGEEDPILPLPNGEALATGIPGARLMVLKGVGHELPPAEIPAIVTAVTNHMAARI